ncbi:MAG: DUF6516 family protein [Candidatus Methanoperedens sp.]|jgi:hypothetical protein|nr:DUF6516 family protein [Candidatus Methanoperedens sp.]
MFSKRLITIARCAEDHFPDILGEAPMIYSDKVRLMFVDGSYMDIRYPVDSKYSFHWQREHEIIRIDTAPHHRELSTYPAHMHIGKEEDVVEDTVTNMNNSIEENVRNVLGFVRRILEK